MPRRKSGNGRPPEFPLLEFRYELPLPPQQLSPNSGGRLSRHWRAVATPKRAYRELCSALIRGAERPARPMRRAAVGCVIRVCRKRLPDTAPLEARDCYRPRDVWNAVAALKPLYDALVDAGVLTDDDQEHCEMDRHVIETVDSHRQEGVHVFVREV